jgi:hypothetical protein
MGCLFQPRPVLYVVLPYFNFCGFKKRRELFIKFVDRLKLKCEIRLIVSEMVGPAPLPRMPVWKHLRFPTKNRVWVKESLINVAVSHLPVDWQYVAWIDADITFLNSTWIRDTIKALDGADVVQMWQTAVNLGPADEAIKIDKSFAYMFKGSGTPWVQSDKYGYWHPGYAWACTRRAWEQMTGLVDWAILGSGDRHMAMALAGRALQSAPGNVHPNYKTLLEEYQKLCEGLRVSWVPGTILHHWHGSLANRRYRERWEILTKNNFDPFKDIAINDGHVLLTRTGLRFIGDLDEYFLGRREDDVV